MAGERCCEKCLEGHKQRQKADAWAEELASKMAVSPQAVKPRVAPPGTLGASGTVVAGGGIIRQDGPGAVCAEGDVVRSWDAATGEYTVYRRVVWKRCGITEFVRYVRVREGD